MPDLAKSLQGRDLGHLKIVADLWGVELSAPDAHAAQARLVKSLLDRPLVIEVVAALPSEARAALDELVSQAGRLPWSVFARRFGQVREMGPARRDREQPHLNPVSPAEMLWYRGLLGRAFFDAASGPEEFAYVPDDLAELLPPAQPRPDEPPGRRALPAERLHPLPANDRILDHACTLLAALRLRLPAAEIEQWAAGWSSPQSPLSVSALRTLLNGAGLLDAEGLPLPEPARLFLEAPRREALAMLARTWLASSEFNDLRLVPGLLIEGDWQNDPLRARQAVLDHLSSLSTWDELAEPPFWSLASFVEAIRRLNPDFQRPAGDYDSWFLRSAATGDFLRGFEQWQAVDGALIRYIITGPLHWLGMVDLACPELPQPCAAHASPEALDTPVTAFRFTAFGAALLCGEIPAPAAGGESAPAPTPADEAALEKAPIQVRSDARLVAPRLAARSVRYQLARFGLWIKESPDFYEYRLTPASLARARQQGLTTGHLLALLRRHAQSIAPSLVRALERWERNGVEARFEQVVVLRLSSPELLQTLRNSRAARFLGEPLGPTSVIVKAGATEKVLAILAEMGYLSVEIE